MLFSFVSLALNYVKTPYQSVSCCSWYLMAQVNFIHIVKICFLHFWIDSLLLESYHTKSLTLCESFHNILNRVKFALIVTWKLYDLYWINSILSESFQSTSWAFWINSNYVWIVSIIIVHLACILTVWIDSHI